MKDFVKYSLVVLSVISFSSCKSEKEKPVETSPVTSNDIVLTNSQFESSNMELAPMKLQSFRKLVNATGTVEVPPENKVEVSSYFGGTVRDIKLLPGEYVKKGQFLFSLVNPEYIQLQQDYLEAKGQLAYLRSDYERQKNLAQDNVTSQKIYLKAESDYQVNQVRFQSLAKKLSLMNINPDNLSLDNLKTSINIYSPISGYVTHVNISKGSYLNPAVTAVSVVNTQHIHMEINVFEKDMQNIRVGQPIIIRTQDGSKETYDAVVHLINKVVDPEKKTVGIHGHLKNENAKTHLYPGMYIEAQIFTNSENLLSLPSEAIVEADDKYYVLELKSKSADKYTFSKREVNKGLSSENQTEIINYSNFNPEAQFLVKGAFNLIKD